MGMNEVLAQNFEIADQKLLDLMDLKYVSATTDDDGTVNDVTVPAGMSGEEKNALEDAAAQDGAQGGEGFYVQKADGSWQKADNMLGTYYMQSQMKSITDITGSMTTGISKQGEAAKTVVSTYKNLG